MSNIMSTMKEIANIIVNKKIRNFNNSETNKLTIAKEICNQFFYESLFNKDNEIKIAIATSNIFDWQEKEDDLELFEDIRQVVQKFVVNILEKEFKNNRVLIVSNMHYIERSMNYFIKLELFYGQKLEV